MRIGLEGRGLVCLLVLLVVLAGADAQIAVTAFPPAEQWKAAVLAGDAAGLKGLYSSEPSPIVYANGVKAAEDADTAFWLGLKPRALETSTIRDETARTGGRHHVIFRAEVTGQTGKPLTVIEDQYWARQGDVWRLVVAIRTDAPKLSLPANMDKDLYPAYADAHADLAAAEKFAAEGHKRVLLVFGANWCYDCHVLDLAFQRPDIADALAAGYEVVHVDLGPDERKNTDLVERYQIPLNKGVPALAVAESDGTLLISQKNGEFENVRGMTAGAILEFLNRWKPKAE